MTVLHKRDLPPLLRAIHDPPELLHLRGAGEASLLARPAATLRRAPDLERVAPGVAVSRAEVVLDRGTRPANDPLLLLRAAAEAAERRLVLAPATAGRLAREGRPVPEPWSREARNLFTRLLAAGPGLLAVWETLDETGALERVLPALAPQM